MPVSSSFAAITLKAVSHRLPDGTALFTDLDISFPVARTGLVGRNGVGKSTLLHLIAGTLPMQSGTIERSGTLRLLAQDPAAQPGRTLADLFGLVPAFDRLARLETGAGGPDDLDAADWTLPARFDAALERAGLPALAPKRRLDTLSGGEVTRAALAALTFDAPDILLLDEPSNNLDQDGRRLVHDLLASWPGAALVVSHDRMLLETMDRIAEMTSLGFSFYGGNWSAYAELKAEELAAADHRLATAERDLDRLDRAAQQRSERKARRDGVGKASRVRNDMPKILLNARRDRAERTGGDNANLAARRRGASVKALSSARADIEVLQPVRLTLPPTGLPRARHVLSAVGLCGGHSPGSNVIADFSLNLTGPERLALVGPNGVGKSTLLALLTGALAPSGGMAHIHVPYVMMDQAVSVLDPDLTIRENYLRLNPDEDENACRAALARFRFRGEVAGQVVSTLSGGQRLGAGLAATIGSGTPPQLLILDEPTNPLDLDALAAVEAGLRAYDGALLVVSHDRAFLNAIGVTREIALE